MLRLTTGRCSLRPRPRPGFKVNARRFFGIKELFLSEKGWLKVLIACATGKKTHDKRQDLKLKDDRREMDRAMKRGA